jgi:hypothetical protein
MLFESFYNANGPAADDLQRGMTIAARVTHEYDYSHLVDRLLKPRETVKRTGFDAMLTDYDHILLQFGMHIACES